MDRFIDTHVHFWKYTKDDFPWIGESDKKLTKNFNFSDYIRASGKSNHRQIILVQARQCGEENHFLCDQANLSPEIVAVVGWLNLQANDIAQGIGQMKNDARFIKLAGVRHLVQDELDVRFMLRPAFINGLLALKSDGLTFDVLIRNTQFGQFLSLLQVLPESKSPTLILDHMGKPKIGGDRESFLRWKHDITRAARYSQVFCKLSGLLTQMGEHAKIDDIKPYVETVFEVFGPDRLMLGSDWPVCTLKGSLDKSLSIGVFLKSRTSSEEWDKISYLTAQKAYGLPS